MNLDIVCDFLKIADIKVKNEFYNLAYFGELTSKKIAERCDISEDKAKSIKHYFEMCTTQDKIQDNLVTVKRPSYYEQINCLV